MRKILGKCFLVILSIGLALLVFEVGGRFFVRESKTSYGRLFKIRLPPLKVVRPSKPQTLESCGRLWRSKTYPNPLGLAEGDLFDFHREEPGVGYVPVENYISPHGWVQTNNIGAYAPTATTVEEPRGKKRMLIFGESFAHSSRIPQSQAWHTLLARDMPSLDVVDLGADGYSMGQALLRFRKIRDNIRWQDVVFVLVPDPDLWRDLSVSRYIGDGWKSYTLRPRFVLEGEGLRLVLPPYENSWDLIKLDLPELTPTVRAHLRTYDAFYTPLLYEEPTGIGHLLSYKIVAAGLGRLYQQKVWDQAQTCVACEATEIARRIFKEVKDEAETRHGHFYLVILPDPDFLDLARKNKNVAELKIWHERVQSFQRTGVDVLDLLDDLRNLPAVDLDRGYDGTHYGAKTNRFIATILAQKFKEPR